MAQPPEGLWTRMSRGPELGRVAQLSLGAGAGRARRAGGGRRAEQPPDPPTWRRAGTP